MIFRTGVFAVAILWAASAAAQGMGPQGPGLLQGLPPVSAVPKDALKEPEDQMRAKGLTSCKEGDRVLASHEGRWIPALVIAVDPEAKYPCKVHLLGRPPSLDASFAAWMLRPEPTN
ncbi:MAG: hypothetical protein JSR47_14745 [Proteobacteria bacterium]|nr:hypothetical protein [Pseudomonadota bacterium]